MYNEIIQMCTINWADTHTHNIIMESKTTVSYCSVCESISERLLSSGVLYTQFSPSKWKYFCSHSTPFSLRSRTSALCCSSICRRRGAKTRLNKGRKEQLKCWITNSRRLLPKQVKWKKCKALFLLKIDVFRLITKLVHHWAGNSECIN